MCVYFFHRGPRRITALGVSMIYVCPTSVLGESLFPMALPLTPDFPFGAFSLPHMCPGGLAFASDWYSMRLASRIGPLMASPLSPDFLFGAFSLPPKFLSGFCVGFVFDAFSLPHWSPNAFAFTTGFFIRCVYPPAHTHRPNGAGRGRVRHP